MRQLNIAQRSANFVASVRDCAFVVTNQVRLFLTDLLHAHLGTSDKRTGYERPDSDSWSQGWIRIMRPEMSPATCSKPSSTFDKRGS